MFGTIQRLTDHILYKSLCVFTAFSFLFTSIIPPSKVQAQVMPQAVLNLPAVGSMVGLTPVFNPPIINGINVHLDDPLKFDFIINRGDDNLGGQDFEDESQKLIKYFLAALTVPEDQMWVNLSPYEKNRIIPDSFGQTEMGRDLLAQDYLLKQLTASLMYPEEELGKEFWKRVYKKSYEQFGTTEIPMNTFNKIWIMPETATVYEHSKGAYVVESHLKVMLEEDYLALEANLNTTNHGVGKIDQGKIEVISGINADVVREVLLPEIEREVNTGKTFANLRQIYNSVILATWYKQNLKTSLLGQVYADQNKTKGIETNDPEVNQKIYDQYVEAFKKGVYNYIKEDYDPTTQEIIPRKYFSGGAVLASSAVTKVIRDGEESASSSISSELIIREKSSNIVTAVLDPSGVRESDLEPDSESTSSPIVNLLGDESLDFGYYRNTNVTWTEGQFEYLDDFFLNNPEIQFEIENPNILIIGAVAKEIELMRKRFPQGNITAINVDYSELMDIANHFKGVNNLNLIRVNAAELDRYKNYFPDQKFDFIFSDGVNSGTFNNGSDDPRSLWDLSVSESWDILQGIANEELRVLKNGGIIFHHSMEQYYSKSILRGELIPVEARPGATAFSFFQKSNSLFFKDEEQRSISGEPGDIFVSSPMRLGDVLESFYAVYGVLGDSEMREGAEEIKQNYAYHLINRIRDSLGELKYLLQDISLLEGVFSNLNKIREKFSEDEQLHAEYKKFKNIMVNELLQLVKNKFNQDEYNIGVALRALIGIREFIDKFGVLEDEKAYLSVASTIVDDYIHTIEGPEKDLADLEKHPSALKFIQNGEFFIKKYNKQLRFPELKRIGDAIDDEYINEKIAAAENRFDQKYGESELKVVQNSKSDLPSGASSPINENLDDVTITSLVKGDVDEEGLQDWTMGNLDENGNRRRWFVGLWNKIKVEIGNTRTTSPPESQHNFDPLQQVTMTRRGFLKLMGASTANVYVETKPFLSRLTNQSVTLSRDTYINLFLSTLTSDRVHFMADISAGLFFRAGHYDFKGDLLDPRIFLITFWKYFQEDPSFNPLLSINQTEALLEFFDPVAYVTEQLSEDMLQSEQGKAVLAAAEKQREKNYKRIKQNPAFQKVVYDITVDEHEKIIWHYVINDDREPGYYAKKYGRNGTTSWNDLTLDDRTDLWQQTEDFWLKSNIKNLVRLLNKNDVSKFVQNMREGGDHYLADLVGQVIDQGAGVLRNNDWFQNFYTDLYLPRERILSQIYDIQDQEEAYFRSTRSSYGFPQADQLYELKRNKRLLQERMVNYNPPQNTAIKEDNKKVDYPLMVPDAWHKWIFQLKDLAKSGDVQIKFYWRLAGHPPVMSLVWQEEGKIKERLLSNAEKRTVMDLLPFDYRRHPKEGTESVIVLHSGITSTEIVVKLKGFLSKIRQEKNRGQRSINGDSDGGATSSPVIATLSNDQAAERLAQIVKGSKKERNNPGVALLVGAGVSAEAGHYGWSEFRQNLISMLLRSTGADTEMIDYAKMIFENNSAIAPERTMKTLFDNLYTEEMEVVDENVSVMEKYNNQFRGQVKRKKVTQSILDAMQVFNYDKPSEVHMNIARLMQRGDIRHVISLNYDVLIEKALYKIGMQRITGLEIDSLGEIGTLTTTMYTEDGEKNGDIPGGLMYLGMDGNGHLDGDGVFYINDDNTLSPEILNQLVAQNIPIIHKIHGSAEFDRRHTAIIDFHGMDLAFPEAIRTNLVDIMANHVLVSLGTSWQNPDIAPMLIKIAKWMNNKNPSADKDLDENDRAILDQINELEKEGFKVSNSGLLLGEKFELLPQQKKALMAFQGDGLSDNFTAVAHGESGDLVKSLIQQMGEQAAVEMSAQEKTKIFEDTRNLVLTKLNEWTISRIGNNEGHKKDVVYSVMKALHEADPSGKVEQKRLVQKDQSLQNRLNAITPQNENLSSGNKWLEEQRQIIHQKYSIGDIFKSRLERYETLRMQGLLENWQYYHLAADLKKDAMHYHDAYLDYQLLIGSIGQKLKNIGWFEIMENPLINWNQNEFDNFFAKKENRNRFISAWKVFHLRILTYVELKQMFTIDSQQNYFGNDDPLDQWANELLIFNQIFERIPVEILSKTEQVIGKRLIASSNEAVAYASIIKDLANERDEQSYFETEILKFRKSTGEGGDLLHLLNIYLISFKFFVERWNVDNAQTHLNQIENLIDVLQLPEHHPLVRQYYANKIYYLYIQMSRGVKNAADQILDISMGNDFQFLDGLSELEDKDLWITINEFTVQALWKKSNYKLSNNKLDHKLLNDILDWFYVLDRDLNDREFKNLFFVFSDYFDLRYLQVDGEIIDYEKLHPHFSEIINKFFEQANRPKRSDIVGSKKGMIPKTNYNAAMAFYYHQKALRDNDNGAFNEAVNFYNYSIRTAKISAHKIRHSLLLAQLYIDKALQQKKIEEDLSEPFKASNRKSAMHYWNIARKVIERIKELPFDKKDDQRLQIKLDVFERLILSSSPVVNLQDKLVSEGDYPVDIVDKIKEVLRYQEKIIDFIGLVDISEVESIILREERNVITKNRFRYTLTFKTSLGNRTVYIKFNQEDLASDNLSSLEAEYTQAASKYHIAPSSMVLENVLLIRKIEDSISLEDILNNNYDKSDFDWGALYQKNKEAIFKELGRKYGQLNKWLKILHNDTGALHILITKNKEVFIIDFSENAQINTYSTWLKPGDKNSDLKTISRFIDNQQYGFNFESFSARQEVLEWLKEGYDSVGEKLVSSPVEVEKGGIDLNPNTIDMQLEKENGTGLQVPLASPELIQQLQNVEGFVPVIINVAPVMNLPLLLGLENVERRHNKEPIDSAQDKSLDLYISKKRFEIEEMESLSLLNK